MPARATLTHFVAKTNETKPFSQLENLVSWYFEDLNHFFFEQTDRKSLQRIQFVFFLFFQGSSPNLFVCLFLNF